MPQPAHTVIVMFENRGYSQIIGSSQAPYLNELAHQGALFTNSRAISRPGGSSGAATAAATRAI